MATTLVRGLEKLKGNKKGAGAPLTLDLSGTEATLATLVDSLIYYFRMLTEWGGHTVRVIGNAKNFATRFVRGAKKCGLKVCRRASRADESGCCEPLRCSAVRAAVVVVVRLAFEKEPWILNIFPKMISSKIFVRVYLLFGGRFDI